MSSRLLSMPRGWVPPLIIQPRRQHKQTLIILHGRGSSAEDMLFGLGVDQQPSSEGSAENLKKSAQPDKLHYSTMQNALPHTKFVFLTAPNRACTLLGGVENRQWFDNASLVNPEEKQQLQMAGLRETTTVVHRLITNDIHDSGKRLRFAMLGFSQGAAAALICGLLWSANNLPKEVAETSLVAIVSMSGWLPFRGILEGSPDQESSAGSETGFTRLEHVRRTLGIDQVYRNEEATATVPLLSRMLTSSILLCHGLDDQWVKPSLSRMAAKALNDLAIFDVQVKEYESLQHTISDSEICDVSRFLREKFDETVVV